MLLQENNNTNKQKKKSYCYYMNVVLKMFYSSYNPKICRYIISWNTCEASTH